VRNPEKLEGAGRVTAAGERATPARTGLRAALALLAVSSALTGLPAALVPRTFYDDFPFVASWVDKLPPYNAHLVTDVGGFYLAFAVLFAWAALRPTRALVVPLCCAWALAAALHLLFHVTHLGGLGTADAIAELGGLAALLALPVAVLVVLRRPGAA
jgi:hypothetical protein